MICKECKRDIEDNNICPYCNTVNKVDETNIIYSYADYRKRIEEKEYIKNNKYGNKSRFCAGIFQLLCGCIGLGRFYMGYKTMAVLQIITSALTCGIGGVLWGFVDAYMIFTNKINYDGNGDLLI